MNEFMQRAGFQKRPVADDEVPPELARALDASAEDLKNGRIMDLNDMLREMEAELEAHLVQKRGPQGQSR